MSELYDIEELLDGTFNISFKLTDCYQRKDPILTDKLKCAEYIKCSFCRGQNTIRLLTLNKKIVITQIFQRYALKWYHTYLLHQGLKRKETMISNICTGPELEKPPKRK